MGSNYRFHADVMAMDEEVTGSSKLVIAKFPDGETTRFVADCGLFQEEEYSKFNTELSFNPEEVDFTIVTHVHVDHVGRLPYMVKNGYTAPIYASETTCKLMPLALKDSCKVLSQVARRKNTKVLYTEDDVENTLKLTRPVPFGTTMQFNDRIKITFLNNGHLVGAASILVQISYPGEDDINLLFSGDYNNKNIFFDVDPIPDWILDLPITIIQESTYGNMDSTEITTYFKRNIKKHLNKGGTVVVPVFSLGRSQEILFLLKTMQDSGELSKLIPIYFDGKLAIRYTDLYVRDGLGNREDMRDFLPENLTYVDRQNRGSVLYGTNKKIILTTSGMGSYGPAQTYIPEYISRRNALIQFTGYTAEGTLGDRLKRTEYGEMVEVGGVVARKVADVEYTTEFSAHAKADEMIEFLKRFRNLKLVLVNHGEAETKKIFASRIVREVDTKRVGLLSRQYFFRINPYGLVKTLSAEFE